MPCSTLNSFEGRGDHKFDQTENQFPTDKDDQVMRLFVGYSNLHIILSKTNTIVLLKPIFSISGQSTSTTVNPQLPLSTIV
jgi:hypothetical protein